jgi:LytS/YehU family sensor histidine kinase
LRYTLDEERGHEVPLKEEIEVAKSYLEIEKVRFGEQLIVNYNVDNASLTCLVPSFLLNPLVENAIKHGFRTSRMPLTIDIDARVKEETTLIVEITNSGRLEDPSRERDADGATIGLSNMRKRLDALYSGAHKFELFERAGAVHARMSLFNIRR